MSTTMNVEEIISKCRKLSRLSRSSNPNEAALAASKLAELMLKFQISEIDLSVDTETKVNVTSHLFESSNKKSHWRMTVASGCSKLFNCIPYWLNGSIYLIGREDDVNLCKYLHQSIIEQIEFLCSSEWGRYWLETCLMEGDEEESIEQGDSLSTCSTEYDPGQGHTNSQKRPRKAPSSSPDRALEDRRSWSQSFLLSCSKVVKSRLLEKHRSMMSNLPQTSTALTVFRDRYKQSLEYANSLNLSKKSKHSPSSSSIHGSISGEISGRKVRIDKEVTSNINLLKG